MANGNSSLTLEASDVTALDGTLRDTIRALGPAERALWQRVLRRAAAVPGEDPAGGRGPGLAGGIIMGERDVIEAILRGGGHDPKAIGPKQDDPAAIGPKQDDPSVPGRGGNDPKAIGPKQDDPAAIGPKQDDPSVPGRGGNDPKAIGPKQDDPVVGPATNLGRRIHALLGGLAPTERAILGTLLQRAARAPGHTPSDGPEMSLTDALLVEPKEGGPGRGPARPR